MAEAMNRVAGDCPDLETIAAYLDNRLDARARARIAEHLASCSDCYSTFVQAADVLATPGPWQRKVDRLRHVRDRIAAAVDRVRASATAAPMRWSLGGALTTAAAALLVVGGVALVSGGRPPAELRALVAAVGTERTIEGRLTGGFAYGPLRSPMRSGEAAAPVPPDVRIAAAQIEKQSVAHRTPETLRSLGIAYLVMGDLARAVPVLEEAVDQPGPGPKVFSDLAAAYLARGLRTNQPQDLPKALAMADRATKVDPRLAEGWFNKAYALERLSLVDQARVAWQAYLALDNRSGWATEARSHLRALENVPRSDGRQHERDEVAAAVARRDPDRIRELVRRFPETAREWTEDQLLHVWPRAVLEKSPAAAADAIAAASVVGTEMAVVNGDRFAADILRAVVATSPDPIAAQRLATAHERFRAASADYNEDRLSASVTAFRSLVDELDRARSPLATWARLYVAIGQYYAGDLRGALVAMDPIVEEAARRRYTRLLGLTYRVRGLVEVVRSDYASGLEDYRHALACFEQAGDVDNEASLHELLAEDLDFLGESDMAWAELSSSLALLPRVDAYRARHLIFQGAALAALRQGLPETASYFESATLDNATRWERPLAIFNAHMYQGEIQRQLGNVPSAITSLELARAALAHVGDPQLVARDEAQIQLAHGEVEWRRRPDAAIDALTKALTMFRRARTDWPLVRVLLARGRAHLAAGHDDLAEADFRAGIDIFENQRASIASEALRSASFERPWDLFTEMIRFLAVNRRQPDRALAYAERGRSRTLVESLASTRAASPVDPVSARAALPARVTMVYYATLDDRLLIWALTRGRVDFVDTPVRHAELIHLLEQFRSERDSAFAGSREMASLTRLYDVLIRPIASRIASGSQLVVVPDGALHAVPFAALLRREDRRYLIEDCSVEVTPSFTMFLAASSKLGTSAPRTTSALVIGNPRIAGVDANVPDLPEAETEASEVAALYETRRLLVGEAATRREFMANARRHDVVHFAGHAIANDERPELSRLLFAGADEATRSLFARDIATQTFETTQLVVLGACRTSVGRIRRGEGVFSLARPFLAAGVPTVVATLWDVDDRAGRRVLVAFHRAFRQSGDAADALRRAQLQVMGEGEPALQAPTAWAGFTVIGGRSPQSDPTSN